MDETKIEKHYQKQAEEIIDTLYDAGYFAPEVKREDLRKVEDLLAYYFQSSVNSAIKSHDLLRQVRSTK